MPDLELLSQQWVEHAPAVWREVQASLKSGGFDTARIALALSMNAHLPQAQVKEMIITAEVKLDSLQTRVSELLDDTDDAALVSRLSDETEIPMAIVDIYVRNARKHD